MSVDVMCCGAATLVFYLGIVLLLDALIRGSLRWLCDLRGLPLCNQPHSFHLEPEKCSSSCAILNCMSYLSELCHHSIYDVGKLAAGKSQDTGKMISHIKHRQLAL